jgi:ribosomal protein S18 acetylase RimI-like enzyme
VLERSRGLSPASLAAIAELERRVVGADGGRLKLEWGNLRTRPNDQVNDFLWWAGDNDRDDAQLLGFCGVYRFGGSDPEIAGMVDPEHRRRGIGAALFDAVASNLRGRGIGRGLLVVPRVSAAGRQLAQQRGGVLDHSEHAMVLDGEPTDGPTDPDLSLRTATIDDAESVGRILKAAFEWTPPDLPGLLSRNTGAERTLIVEQRGVPVGTLRITHVGDTGGIYGFAVDPAQQGRGIGRDVLRRSCRILRDEGMRSVGLEVAVENERALGLYTSIGFRPVTTEDYYALSFAS